MTNPRQPTDRQAAMTDDVTVTDTKGWPPRPAGEVFPELLDTILVAQLLLYDRRGMTTEQARRNVRNLRESGLPTLGRIGSTLMFRKDAVINWLASREEPLDGSNDRDSMGDA